MEKHDWHTTNGCLPSLSAVGAMHSIGPGSQKLQRRVAVCREETPWHMPCIPLPAGLVWRVSTSFSHQHGLCTAASHASTPSLEEQGRRPQWYSDTEHHRGPLQEEQCWCSPVWGRALSGNPYQGGSRTCHTQKSLAPGSSCIRHRAVWGVPCRMLVSSTRACHTWQWVEIIGWWESNVFFLVREVQSSLTPPPNLKFGKTTHTQNKLKRETITSFLKVFTLPKGKRSPITVRHIQAFCEKEWKKRVRRR